MMNPTSSTRTHYISNSAPLTPSPLLKLPLGAIQAKGWLQKQLDLMLHGTAGHLDEISKFLQDDNGWLDPDGIGWEEQPYWLRGFLPLAVLTKDEAALAKVKKWIEAILASQQEDGFFGPQNLRSVPGKDGRKLCDIWPHMVMAEVLIQYHEYSEDARVIPFLTRFFDFCRQIPDDEFINIKHLIDPDGFPAAWHAMKQDIPWKNEVQHNRASEVLPHIFWLYNQTGEDWLPELAERFFNANNSSDGPWLEVHNVHFTQHYKYFAVHAQLTGDPDGIRESESWYDKHMATWGQQPRGIFGGDEIIRDGKTDPRQAFETCGMIEFAKSFYMLGRISGDPMYADRCEDILLNHFPAAHSPDYRGLHYLTASNMPQLDAGNRHDFHNQKPQICYSPHMYRCCQHNDAMGWTEYTQNLWQATTDNGLAAWLYAPSVVQAKVADGRQISVETITDYPFKTDVEFRVTAHEAVCFPLYLRIPAWCQDFQVSLNGKIVQESDENKRKGFFCLNRTWTSGDVIQIHMAVEISVTEWPQNKSLTVNRGPLSYSVKIKEKWQRFSRFEKDTTWQEEAHFNTPDHMNVDIENWPEWEVFPDSPWNYGLLPDQPVEIQEKPLTDANPWTLENAPIELTVAAKRLPGWTLDSTDTIAEVPISPVQANTSLERITLIPLGCARLRVACLPKILP